MEFVSIMEKERIDEKQYSDFLPRMYDLDWSKEDSHKIALSFFPHNPLNSSKLEELLNTLSQNIKADCLAW